MKGEKIELEIDASIRPTRQQVREAVFQIWADFIEGATLLDPFAGSGAIVLEALSRGADEIYASDIRADYLFNLRKRLHDLGKKRKGLVETRRILISSDDYKEALSIHFASHRKFDLVYLDPPYQSDFGIDAVKLIFRYNLLSENGRIMLETSKREAREVEQFLKDEDNILLLKKYKHGDTYLYHLIINEDT